MFPPILYPAGGVFHVGDAMKDIDYAAGQRRIVMLFFAQWVVFVAVLAIEYATA